jgi:hypothetical protein
MQIPDADEFFELHLRENILKHAELTTTHGLLATHESL